MEQTTPVASGRSEKMAEPERKMPPPRQADSFNDGAGDGGAGPPESGERQPQYDAFMRIIRR